MSQPPSGQSLTIAGLFAGIGGIELGLHRAGHSTTFLCELDESAQAVLHSRFPDTELVPDVTAIEELPHVDLVTGGFPCQDLSQAGRTAGIEGLQSGLVGHVFRLLSGRNGWRPDWLLLENVPFMLQLDRGQAMQFLTESLDYLGYSWAYRVVDTRSFGLPQRRKRVILLASPTHDPRDVLFADDKGEPDVDGDTSTLACGFYWTEGLRGLGWAVDAIPTLKGGSALGIPSPPAIVMRDGTIVLPEIRDAERLQGFPTNWTKPAESVSRRKGVRWKLVGNAVSVPVAQWVGRRLARPGTYDELGDELLTPGTKWPIAAWGCEGKAYRASVSSFPVRRKNQHLHEFLRYEGAPLSARATAGFLSRAEQSTLNFPKGFLAVVRAHLARVDSPV